MPSSRSDLLSVTRSLLRGARWINWVVMAVLIVVLVGVFVGNPEKMNLTGAALANLTQPQKVLMARAGVTGMLICSLLVWPLLVLLQRIVDSARDGDPFVPENGVRLRRIGWLILAINVVTTSMVHMALKGFIGFPPVSFSGVLTVLMIFVIARIFETGAAMRSELRETV
jgi:hypothetical protein